MCRLSAFFGAPICAADLVTRPSRSIITQSFDARERMSGDASTPGYLNGDGFGLGWYADVPDDVVPCVYRQARPAWNDPNVAAIAEKVYTPVLFAHVRAASPGLDVSEGTCHPFRYGRYLWMHNGGVGGFKDVRRRVLGGLGQEAFDFAVTHGSSDTALCFAVFLDRVDDKMARASPARLRECLEETIRVMEEALRDVRAEETSLLNFVVSDGETLVASRYVVNLSDEGAEAASLYYASGNSYQADEATPGNYTMKHTDRRPSLVIISSEPLTERRAEWVSVPRNASVMVTKSMHVLVAPIQKTPDPFIARVLGNVGEHGGEMAGRKIAVAERKEGRAGGGYNVGGTVLSTVTIPGRTVLCCVVMGSLLCSGTDDGTIHLWDLEDNLFFQELSTGQRAVLAMVTDAELGILVVATSAATVIVFQAEKEGGKFAPSFTVFCKGHGDVLSLTRVGAQVYAGFSDARVLCVLENVADRLPAGWDAESERPESGCAEMEDDLGVARLYAGRAFPRTANVPMHYGFVFAMTTCLQDRFLCTGSGDGLLRLWEVEEEKCVQTCDDHAGAILALVAYDNQYGTMLFSGSRDCSVKVWVWNGDNGFICKRTLRKHKDEVVFLAIFGDKLVSGSADGAVCVWSAETMALLCQYRDKSLKAGAVSVEYNLLFTAADEGAVQIRDMLSTERDLERRDSLMRDASEASSAEEDGADAKENRQTNKAGNGLLSKKSTGSAGNRINGDFCPSDSGDSIGIIISEVANDTDESDTLVPGVANEMVLAPPMSPLVGSHSAQVNTTTKERGSIDNQTSQNDSIESIGKLPDTSRTAEANNCQLKSKQDVSEKRLMQNVLDRFVSFATVSGSEYHREQCWQGARYIGTFLEGLGASVKYVGTSETASEHINDADGAKQSTFLGSNPVVLARFACANPTAKAATFYGHYDVMPAEGEQWNTDPWSLRSVDGFFYGRGSTDNKGPIVAAIFAIKTLLEENRDGIGCNLTLVLQGEGECSNTGFKECIQKHLHWFEKTSLILTSNSYWLGEKKPCITYGFRGLVELRVSVTGGNRNLHSGVDGGAIIQPLNDLITILGTLVDAEGAVRVPGFYEDVRPLTDVERNRLHDVDFTVDEYRNGTGVDQFTSGNASELLESRWRKPSVSITSINTSNDSGFFSVIPREAVAKISIRFVPDQDPAKIEDAVASHLGCQMKRRNSPNTLDVTCVNKGDWWLGDPNSAHFQIAERAVKEVWGVSPDYVCEGGSMPLFSYLVKTLNAPLLQIPLGQASDGAHLPNERIRAVNLFKGKQVLQHIIQDFAESDM